MNQCTSDHSVGILKAEESEVLEDLLNVWSWTLHLLSFTSRVQICSGRIPEKDAIETDTARPARNMKPRGSRWALISSTWGSFPASSTSDHSTKRVQVETWWSLDDLLWFNEHLKMAKHHSRCTYSIPKKSHLLRTLDFCCWDITLLWWTSFAWLGCCSERFPAGHQKGGVFGRHLGCQKNGRSLWKSVTLISGWARFGTLEVLQKQTNRTWVFPKIMVPPNHPF